MLLKLGVECPRNGLIARLYATADRPTGEACPEIRGAALTSLPPNDAGRKGIIAKRQQARNLIGKMTTHERKPYESESECVDFSFLHRIFVTLTSLQNQNPKLIELID